MRTGFIKRAAGAWYRWFAVVGLTVTAGRLEPWQRRPVGVDTDGRSFVGVQLAGWHVGVCR